MCWMCHPWEVGGPAGGGRVRFELMAMVWGQTLLTLRVRAGDPHQRCRLLPCGGVACCYWTGLLLLPGVK